MPCTDLGLLGLARVRPHAHQLTDGVTARPPAAASTLSKDRKCPPRNSWMNPGSRHAYAPTGNAEQPCALAPPLPQLSPPPRRLHSRHHRRHRIEQVPRLHIPTAALHFLVSQPTRFTSSAAQKAPRVVQDLQPASRDMVMIRPVNNTFTLSIVDSTRAQAYLRITSLPVSGNTFTVHLYAPSPHMLAYSSNCKHRYVQRAQRPRALVPDPCPSTPGAPPAAIRSLPFRPRPAVAKPSSQPTHLTQPRGTSCSPSEPQVVALQQ
ncbi:hypothetical protein HPB52_022961 [Rhipicephalus sanguineus]|uniref:Uncharacterized protein n=1 Tax=Rhipicephalus sanguineus TaxID=34632 RepID=A0A9D4SRM9_RHISA|nr:hypothetical protein HPB52_022961 [Rhipicephalus sanguineus]